MNFFLDHNMPRGLANALHAIGEWTGEHQFEHFRDHWETDPGDTVWIPWLAAREGDWKLISGDRKILRTPQNRSAIIESQLVAFFMPKGFPNFVKWTQASHFFKWFVGIERTASRAPRGSLFYVNMNGTIERATL